jgi:hypothetical protein
MKDLFRKDIPAKPLTFDGIWAKHICHENKIPIFSDHVSRQCRSPVFTQCHSHPWPGGWWAVAGSTEQGVVCFQEGQRQRKESRYQRQRERKPWLVLFGWAVTCQIFPVICYHPRSSVIRFLKSRIRCPGTRLHRVSNKQKLTGLIHRVICSRRRLNQTTSKNSNVLAADQILRMDGNKCRRRKVTAVLRFSHSEMLLIGYQGL